jgi:hypothetical protein
MQEMLPGSELLVIHSAEDLAYQTIAEIDVTQISGLGRERVDGTLVRAHQMQGLQYRPLNIAVHQGQACN